MAEPAANGNETKRRGTGFPQLALQEAVDAVVLAGQNGRDHTQDAFAAYLGHRTANSGAFRAKLASLRDWDLIDRGGKERVTLSPLALELVMVAPGHHEAKPLLVQAFESCRVFGMLYNDSAKNMPLDVSRLRTTVLLRYGVASEQADRFVDSFVKSAVFAGLAEFDGSKLTLFSRDAVVTGNEDGPSNPPMAAAGVASITTTASGSALPRATATQGAVAHPNSVPTALRQAWAIDGGEIEFIIRTPKPLPPSIYALMAEMAVTAAKMEDLLAPDEDSENLPTAESGTPGEN